MGAVDGTKVLGVEDFSVVGPVVCVVVGEVVDDGAGGRDVGEDDGADVDTTVLMDGWDDG